MDEWLVLTEQNWAFWIAGLFALFEFFKWVVTGGEWLVSKFGIETKRTRAQKETREKLLKAEKDIAEIRETSEKNVQTFLDHEKIMSQNFVDVKNEIVQEIGKLHNKIDEQRAHLEDIDSDGKRRDCAILRDRILAGMRYFGQNVDENGNVHISTTDFENMSKMFTEYKNAGGNGLIAHLKETEFDKFIVDTGKSL